jgi:glycosyltransferase involved in cell wall biosynthesis
MKVTILHPFTPQAAGVVEKSVPTYHSQPHVLAMRNLIKKGYECSMEYFTPKLIKYTHKSDALKWTFFPVNLTLNGDHKKWKKQVSNSCLKAYKKNTPDVTIINMSGHSSPFSYELSKIIEANNKKYIAMLGGQHYSDNKRNNFYYKNAHHILVHTHLQKKQMESMEMFKGKDIRVFPLGVNCNIFKPTSQEKESSPKLLYVGRIVEWKRVHLAIEAVKSLIDSGFEKATLDIIGPVSSEEYLVQLKQLVIDLKLEKNVFFLGHKEHSELPYYFQNANLFTLPSDKETFGMVMIEAMACGTPVAGINCPGGPADVITHGKNGILTSPENYTKEIVNYFKDENQQQLVSKQARIKALNEYSIGATSEVLRTSVEDALA